MHAQHGTVRRLAVVRADRPQPSGRAVRRARRISLPPGPAPGEGRFDYLKRTYD